MTVSPQRTSRKPKPDYAAAAAPSVPDRAFDFDSKTFKDYAQGIWAISEIVDQKNDLTALLARKTKFILHVAATDYTVNARGAMRFYDEVVKRHGQTTIDRSVRFFVTPNAEHGSVGHSANHRDSPAALCRPDRRLASVGGKRCRAGHVGPNARGVLPAVYGSEIQAALPLSTIPAVHGQRQRERRTQLCLCHAAIAFPLATTAAR
jgi:hypothetical protein